MADKERLRDKRLQVFLTEEETQILEKKCDEFGVNKSTYIRNAILYGGLLKTMPRIDEEIIKKLIYEMERIGNNVNQIAYVCNATGNASSSEISQIKNELYELFDKLVDTLKGIE